MRPCICNCRFAVQTVMLEVCLALCCSEKMLKNIGVNQQ